MLCGIQTAATASESRTLLDKYLIATDRDRHADALRIINDLLKSEPKNELYIAERARTLMNLDRYAEGIQDATKALKMNPKDANALRSRSFCYLMLKNYRAGIDDLVLAMKYSEPDYVNMWPRNDHDNLARAYSLTARGDLAKKERELARLDQLIEQAVAARETASMERALAICDQVLKTDPKHLDALGFKGLCLNNLTKFKESIQFLSRAISLKPNCVALLYLRADGYIETKQYEKAIADLSKIVARKPQIVIFKYASNTGRLRDKFNHADIDTVNIADIHFLRGSCYVSLMKYNLAINDFKTTLALDPKEYRAAATAANCFFNSKNYKEALAMYTRAVTINPRYWEGYTLRARVYEQLGELDKAAADVSTIIKAQPRDTGAYGLRASIFRKAKLFEKALADYSKMTELAPTDDEGFRNRADTYADLGKLELALKDYDKALTLSAEDKEQIAKSRAAVLQRMARQRAVPAR